MAVITCLPSRRLLKMTVVDLQDVLSRHRTEERTRALRALLMEPLMTASHAMFTAVRRHASELQNWLAREAGWVLQVERDCVRLYKRPADLRDATRGAPDFNRQRYVLFCLAGAVLERADPQITLVRLGEQLLEFAADPDLEARGLRFTLESMHERRDLVQVCRFLLEVGVLKRVAGDEEAYVQHGAGADALYDVQRRVLAALLAAVRGPSTFPREEEPADLNARLTALAQDYVPDSPEGRRTATRHQLTRRLIDDPVVYFDELDAAEREYFANQRGIMGARLGETLELAAELRAEGMALIDADGELSDRQLPAEGTVAHVTLLLAQHLADRAREAPERDVSVVELTAFVRRCADEFGRYWRKAAREPGAETELALEALGHLEALKLLTQHQGAVRVRPALARYAIGEAQIRT